MTIILVNAVFLVLLVIGVILYFRHQQSTWDKQMDEQLKGLEIVSAKIENGTFVADFRDSTHMLRVLAANMYTMVKDSPNFTEVSFELTHHSKDVVEPLKVIMTIQKKWGKTPSQIIKDLRMKYEPEVQKEIEEGFWVGKEEHMAEYMQDYPKN